MSIIYAILTLVIIGACLWLVERFIPLSEPIRMIIRVVVVIGLILFLLSFFGIVDVPTNFKK